MSEILDRLRACHRVTGWVNAQDVRLEMITGEPAPNQGGNVRESWLCDTGEEQAVANEVGRILVPGHVATHTVAEFAGEPDWNRVLVTFEHAADWLSIVPEGSEIVTGLPNPAWAAIAVCDQALGLAIFASEIDASVEARVQVVPEQVLQQLIVVQPID